MFCLFAFTLHFIVCFPDCMNEFAIAVRTGKLTSSCLAYIDQEDNHHMRHIRTEHTKEENRNLNYPTEQYYCQYTQRANLS